VTAAVVGVILNLAVGFAIVTLFQDVATESTFGFTYPRPHLGSVDGFAVALALVSFVGLVRSRWNFLWVIGGSALAGLIYRVAI
ncbi:MAG TPA: chromate transporter, partial [Actinomycetota bacterium]|nr:chromate transporter [Actinomycetota bacterium]